MDQEELHIVVSGGRVTLSFVISFIGALCAVSLNEMARVNPEGRKKQLVLVAVAFNIGGIAIWSMHFVGMSAWSLRTSTGVDVPIRFEIVITIISFIVAWLFVWFGVYVASQDRYFKELMRSQKRNAITRDIAETTNVLADMRRSRFVLYFVLFKNLQRVVIGGCITGFGVCVMHYVGMLAIRADADIEWIPGFVALSVIIAVVAASSGLFIMFRVLQFRPYASLHLICSVIIAIAVCGMHYTGMRAAVFKYHPNNTEWDLVTVHNNELESVEFAVFIICALFDFWVRTDLRQKQESIDNDLDDLRNQLNKDTTRRTDESHHSRSKGKHAGGATSQHSGGHGANGATVVAVNGTGTHVDTEMVSPKHKSGTSTPTAEMEGHKISITGSTHDEHHEGANGATSIKLPTHAEEESANMYGTPSIGGKRENSKRRSEIMVRDVSEQAAAVAELREQIRSGNSGRRGSVHHTPTPSSRHKHGNGGSAAAGGVATDIASPQTRDPESGLHTNASSMPASPDLISQRRLNGGLDNGSSVATASPSLGSSPADMHDSGMLLVDTRLDNNSGV